MDEQKVSSRRLSIRQAGLVIILGMTIIFGGILATIAFASTVGCKPRIENHQRGSLSGDLTVSRPQVSTNITAVNTIRIYGFESEQDIPVIFTIANSHNEVFINITHPHLLTHSDYYWSEFTLEALFVDYPDGFITLTVQRLSNDTYVELSYEAYAYSELCGSHAPYSVPVILGSIIGGILIGYGFRTLSKAEKQASWDYPHN